jgi:hypothetical protein
MAARGVGWVVVLAVLGCGNASVLDPEDFVAGSQGNQRRDGGAGGDNDPAAREPTETGNCGSQLVDLNPQPADLVLVLDRSGSMLENLRDRSSGRFVQKWAEVVGALDSVIGTTQKGAAWGLQLYPMPDGCAVADGLNVPVATENHRALLNEIRNNPAVEGTGATPTQLAVRRAVAELLARPSAGSKYLVLATDGEPSCRPGASARDEDRAGAVQAVADAQAAGVGVFVVGIATEDSAAHATLNEMAERGGRARGDLTRYYPVGSGRDLVWALESITGQIFSCSFPLDAPPPAPDNVLLEIDGHRVPRDLTHQDGWDYGEGERAVVVHGPACESLRTMAPQKVRILYGCS